VAFVQCTITRLKLPALFQLPAGRIVSRTVLVFSILLVLLMQISMIIGLNIQ